MISKVMIIIFTLVNLVMIGAGGVVFTLGLTGYWADDQRFSHLMVGASSLMCWGTLATSFDVLALLGIFQGRFFLSCLLIINTKLSINQCLFSSMAFVKCYDMI